MHLHILSLKKEIRCPSARPTYSKLPDKLHTIGSPSLTLQGAFWDCGDGGGGGFSITGIVVVQITGIVVHVFHLDSVAFVARPSERRVPIRFPSERRATKAEVESL